MASKDETVVVGAGPYGLSVAAHLTGRGVAHRIFGVPMESWRQNMPRGMHLKSDGFASNLYAAEPFTLGQFCRETGRDYHPTTWAVPVEDFIDYGMEFQRRRVPELEETKVTHLKRNADGSFEVRTAAGETMTARNVVLASGIAELEWIPPEVVQLPKELCTHSADHNDMAKFAGKNIAVLGGGSSALDCAALAQEAGAQVDLIARRPAIRYNLHHGDAGGQRSLMERLKYPRSRLGMGWKSKVSVDMQWLVHLLPQRLRTRLVQRHLGPAATWLVKQKVEGKVREHMSSEVVKAEPRDGKLHLTLRSHDGKMTELTVDHLLAGTGYKPLLQLVGYIDEGLRRQIRTHDDRPVLDGNFQSSVPGLYFTGLMAAASFGPAQRFACGAEFAARQVSKHIASR